MALIFDIKRFAINDGPGIRTTLFMKGCPLRCVWCHNPEGLTEAPVKLYTQKKCIGCQSCVEACPEHNLVLTPDGIKDQGHCVACGRCTDECPTLALQLAGKEYDLDDLMAIVEKERQVMEESKGGVTICGGEPFMHTDYLLTLLNALGRKCMHRTVDTTLFTSADKAREVAENCELFLIDIKHMDSDTHRKYTGVPNEQILSNIRLISEMGHDFWIRIPLIEGVNADEANIEATADFIASLPHAPEVVNILPYHDIGKGKHVRLGSLYNPEEICMEEPSLEKQRHVVEIMQSRGLNAKIGG